MIREQQSIDPFRKERVLNLRLSEPMYTAIKEKAEREGMSVSELVRTGLFFLDFPLAIKDCEQNMSTDLAKVERTLDVLVDSFEIARKNERIVKELRQRVAHLRAQENPRSQSCIQPISTSLSPQEVKQIDSLAMRSGVSRAHLVRQLIRGQLFETDKRGESNRKE
ncbi:ribbon-helix-helix protein, CopG family [Acidobacteria bacterium AH-259-L09]|nr:ribbon-helix-helix protein, CopG family [Acidobacteria bacterium AH-259-L09]